MSDVASKVENLMEAMPYLQKYAGKIIVIKYGGNAMINEELKELPNSPYATVLTVMILSC